MRRRDAVTSASWRRIRRYTQPAGTAMTRAIPAGTTSICPSGTPATLATAAAELATATTTKVSQTGSEGRLRADACRQRRTTTTITARAMTAAQTLPMLAHRVFGG